MSKDAGFANDWQELGAEVVAFICEKLSIKPSQFNAEAATQQAADLAKGMGQAALLYLRVENAKAQTQLVIAKTRHQSKG
ncbi:hypothetical protein [Rhodoferax aquaticus]|uniref:Uncharacterized protein n=1 Tax=Rhodoferax aquaticus TaxID=2527691 RepID=A0A515ETA8_9BURK|nr:hypothetical protein [Rhodoferax aquaticus]QDL55916.1 hypothetical protein EXZ61_18005 [Rhodoferax aquaticus]